MQFGWQWPGAKIHDRALNDLARLIDGESKPAVLIKEAQTVLTVVIADPSLTKARDCLAPHELRQFGWQNVQQLSEQLRVDYDIAIGNFNMHNARSMFYGFGAPQGRGDALIQPGIAGRKRLPGRL